MQFLKKILSRREFVRRTAAGWLAAGALPLLTQCGSDGGDTQTVAQTVDSTGDSHTIAITCSSITSPPTDGVSVTSSTSNGHAHTVNITATQLAQIKAGTTVQITSAAGGGHTHVFAVSACA